MSDIRQKADNENDSDNRLGRELDHLYRFAGSMGSNLDVDTLLSDAVPLLLAMAEAEKVLIALTPKKSGPDAMIKHREWPIIPDIELLPPALATLGIDAVGFKDREHLPEPVAKLLEQTEGPWALIPLLAHGLKLGLMVLTRPEKPFGASTLKLLNTAGRQLALAVENSRLFADLQKSYSRIVDDQEELIRSESLTALGGLAATMAHEIRNPLATIFSSLSQIRKHAQMTGDSAVLLEIAEEEAIRINRMVSGLLEFARPKMPKVSGDVPIADMVAEEIKKITTDAEFPAGVELAMDEESENVIARVDPELFKRAVYHVVTNAIAAVDPEKGKISISIQNDTAHGGGVAVTVSDDGCGISNEIQNRIFEPFFSTKPSGTGLGLPVVKRIVEDHNGSLKINSEKGIFTKVQLLFAGKRN